jgi:alkanesulfonate monooxygenase SsuD/methylene tetrahydromethanopterin reductase-like flavin-dependent oxidoreductase (luciferase family)
MIEVLEVPNMKFAVLYNIDYRPDVHRSPSHYYGEILEQVELLEECGYDSVWFGEHHYNGYSFGNPAVIAAAAAMRTKRIRLGTGVSLVPLHHPLKVAEEYAMLDVLSNGRLEYGAGRGYMSYAYDLFGVAQSESAERFREGLSFIDAAWRADGPFSFEGKFITAVDYHFFPKPVQNPPPIYAAAARTPDSYVWAGEKGYHLCTSFFSPETEATRDNIRRYREAVVANGHELSRLDISGVVQMYCAESNEEALQDGGAYAKNYYRFFGDVDRRGSRPIVGDRFQNVDAAEFNRKNQVLLGNPEDLISRIGELRDYFGANMLQLEVAQGGVPHKKVLQVLERFAKRVIPAFSAVRASTKSE